MIDFPYSETVAWGGLAFAGIGTVLAIVFFFGARLFGVRSWWFGNRESAWYPSILLICPAAAVIGFAMSIPGFWTVRQFRAFDLDTVGSLKIRKTDDPNAGVVQYSDIEEIKHALLMMQRCQGVTHQHDELSDGYVMEIVKSDGQSANLYLTVYRKSSKTLRKTVVASYRNMEAGEFNCPGIQNWVASNIDPLFGRTPVP